MKPIAPPDRVLPSNTGPGPVTAIAERLPGETGGDALARIGAAVLPAEDPNKAKGRRARSKQRKLPRQIAAIIAMRTEGMSNRDIAEKMNLSVATVGAYLQKARKELHLSDIVDRVEHRAIPQAVDNLVEGLENRDKDYTLATLRGTGIFRTHTAVKNEGGGEVAKNILIVKFEMPTVPAGTSLPTVAVGNIVGKPRTPTNKCEQIDTPVVEAEVVET